MSEDKTTESRAVDTVKVAVVGVGDTSTMQSGVVAKTPGTHEPNLLVTVVPPARAVAIRFCNVFLIQLGGLLVAAMSPVGSKLLYTSDFIHMFITCVSLSFPGAILGLVKDLITISSRLEQKYPLINA